MVKMDRSLPANLKSSLASALQLLDTIPAPVGINPLPPSSTLNTTNKETNPKKQTKLNSSGLSNVNREGVGGSKEKGQQQLKRRRRNLQPVSNNNNNVTKVPQTKEVEATGGGQSRLPLWRPSNYTPLKPHSSGDLISLEAYTKYSKVNEGSFVELKAQLDELLSNRHKRKATTQITKKNPGPKQPLINKNPSSTSTMVKSALARSNSLVVSQESRQRSNSITKPTKDREIFSDCEGNFSRNIVPESTSVSTPTPSYVRPSFVSKSPVVSSPKPDSATVICPPAICPPVASKIRPYLPASPNPASPITSSQTLPTSPNANKETNNYVGNKTPMHLPNSPLPASPITQNHAQSGLSSFNKTTLILEKNRTPPPSYSTNQNYSTVVPEFTFSYKNPFNNNIASSSISYQPTPFFPDYTPQSPTSNIQNKLSRPSRPPKTTAKTPSNPSHELNHEVNKVQEVLFDAPGFQVDIQGDMDIVMEAANLESLSLPPTDASMVGPEPFSILHINVVKKYNNLKSRDEASLTPEDTNWIAKIDQLAKKEIIKVKAWLKARKSARMNFIPEIAKNSVEKAVEASSKSSCLVYPRFYTFMKTLAVTNKSGNHEFNYESNIADFGSLLELNLPDLREGAKISLSADIWELPKSEEEPGNSFTSALQNEFKLSWHNIPVPALREDVIINQIINAQEIDIVVCSSSLSTLVSSESKTSKGFSLPISFVKVITKDPYDEENTSERMTVLVDKSLPNKTMSPKQINEKYFNSAIKNAFLNSTENNKTIGHSRHGSLASNHSGSTNFKTIPDKFFLTNALSYAVWKFGDLNVLIRTKLHGCIADSQSSEILPVSLKVKLEYLPEFGSEEILNEEKAKWWMHSVIYRNKILVAHVDPLTHSLIKTTEYQADELEASLECPMKQFNIVHAYFQEFLKLPPNDYLVRRQANSDIINLYKSILNQTANPNARPIPISRPNQFQRKLDLHLELKQPFSVTQIPPLKEFMNINWGGLSTSQGVLDRIPFTFPPDPNGRTIETRSTRAHLRSN